MTHPWTLAVCAVGLVCSTLALEGQSLSHYRNFELGSDLASVSALTGVAPSNAKTVHQRPIVLKTLEWRPSRWTSGSREESTDPVEQVRFGFYDDRLFQIIVDYGQERTRGMTPADMVEAISAVYGTALGRASRVAGPAASRLEIESGAALARWGDAEHSVVLYQTSSYGAPFRLILTDSRLESLARKAETQAQRLDEQEAPQREVARQQKERDDARDAAAKARATNRGVFRP